MSKTNQPDGGIAREVRDRCLCFQTQRAARALARRFDEAFRPFGLTNQQFSLMMSLNRADPPGLGAVASGLAMDRTTLTAALKPLQRRGLVRVAEDERDRRGRRVALTLKGRRLLAEALPVWRRVHDEVDAILAPADLEAVRRALAALAPGQDTSR